MFLYRIADRLRRARRPGAEGDPQSAGLLGEDLAHRFLQKQGYTVVARNYRPATGGGELDLVAWEGATLVFVEVKTRARTDFGPPDRAVDLDKQRFLERAALEYARRAAVDWRLVRFDIVNVLLTRPPNVSLIRDAFRLSQGL